MRGPADIPEIVLLSFFPWDHEYPSTAHGLARALARYTRVWFVSKPPTLRDAWRSRGRSDGDRARPSSRSISGFAGRLRVVELSPTLPINALPEGRLYHAARSRVDAKLNRELGAVLRAGGCRECVAINLYNPTQFERLDLAGVRVRQRWYYTVDAIGEARYTGRHGVAAERRQLALSDGALATGTRLGDDVRAFAKTLHVLPNAIDAATFLAGGTPPEPDDLAAVPRPRLAYLGNLDGARLDFELVDGLAADHPGVSFVLIGPWNADEATRARLARHANVYLLGPKPPEACAAYLHHADAGMIPFRSTALTERIYPLKINEYLACGLPVIATPFSPDIGAFGDAIALEPRERWSARLGRLLDDADVDEHSPERVRRRRARAAANTWDHRARRLLDLLGTPAPAAGGKIASHAQ